MGVNTEGTGRRHGAWRNGRLPALAAGEEVDKRPSAALDARRRRQALRRCERATLRTPPLGKLKVRLAMALRVEQGRAGQPDGEGVSQPYLAEVVGVERDEREGEPLAAWRELQLDEHAAKCPWHEHL